MGEYRFLIRLINYAVVILLLLQLAMCQYIITTIAGGDEHHGDDGDATSAIVTYPCGVAVDSSGSINQYNVYYSISIVTKNTTLLILGNLYISEYKRVRKVTAANGIITTIAGGGTYYGTFQGDNGAATSAILRVPSGIAIDSLGRCNNLWSNAFYLFYFLTR